MFTPRLVSLILCFVSFLLPTHGAPAEQKQNRSRRSTADQIISNLGWLDISVSTQELTGIPIGLQKFRGALYNYEYNQQLRDALSTTDAQFRDALQIGTFGSGDLRDVQTVRNAIVYAQTSTFSESIPDDQKVNLLNNNQMQLQGASQLLRYLPMTENARVANNLAFDSYPFTEPAVQCAILLAFAGNSIESDQNYVPYNMLSQVPYERISLVDEFVAGATHMMLRSYEMKADEDHFVEILNNIANSIPDWSKRLSRCKVMMEAGYVNLGSTLEIWAASNENPDAFEDSAKLFVCVAPAQVAIISSMVLRQALPQYKDENFGWQHGYNLINQLLTGTTSQERLTSQFFNELGGLTKFLTMDILKRRSNRDPQFLQDAVLTRSVLKQINQYSDDPLLAEYLWARGIILGRIKAPTVDAGGDVTSMDIERVATLASIMSVAHIRTYSDQQIEENIFSFQTKGLRPGVAFALVEKYLRFRASSESSADTNVMNNNLGIKQGNVLLTQTDFTQMGSLLPALDYRFFLNCTMTSISQAMLQLGAVAGSNPADFQLTPAQIHVIATRVQDDSGRTPSLMTRLGPRISMGLSPAFFLERLTDTDEFYNVRVETGEITDGQEFFQRDWTPFQRSVIFYMYRQEVRSLPITGAMMEQIGKVSTGISAHEILNLDYSEVLGVASQVMKNGGDMNKAWLFSVQIRKAFASMYGLSRLTDFHLGLLGTAQLQALDGLTLRMFSIREMETLTLADCNDVIAKIGDLEDVYLMPPPKRKELVCMYVARCRLILQNNRFVPPHTQNNHMDRFFRARAEDEFGGIRFSRQVPNYCQVATPQLFDDAQLEQHDFDTLGYLVCDLPSHAFRSIERTILKDNLWMFQHCTFEESQKIEINRQIRNEVKQDVYYLRSLAQATCSAIEYYDFRSISSQISADVRNELMVYTQYAYDRFDKMERKYGLTKRHLNYGLFAYRDISRGAQLSISNCFQVLSEQAWITFNDIAMEEQMNSGAAIDNRWDYRQSNINTVRYDTNGGGVISDNNNNNFNAYDDTNTYDSAAAADEYTANRQRRSLRDRDERITCQAVHVLGAGVRHFSIRQLNEMDPRDVANCLHHLGHNRNTTTEQRRTLKDKVEQIFRGFNNIPKEYVVQLNWIGMEMTRDELRNLRLDDWQAINVVSRWEWRNWQRRELYLNIKNRFNLQPQSMTAVEYKALGEFFCGMDSSEIARITPEMYYEMAAFVGELTTCDYNQMRSLLAKARSTQAFGAIETWDERQMLVIGSAIAGMSSSSLHLLTPGLNPNKRNLVAAIPAHVFPMFPDSVMESLDVEFYKAMTPEQVIAIQPRQWHEMRTAQVDAAMQIWFGYDEWPFAYWKGFHDAGAANIWLSLLTVVASYLIHTNL